MKRLHEHKIDDAKYYEYIWDEETNKRPYYDAVRMRSLIQPAKDGDKVLDVGAGVFGAAQYLAEHTELDCELYAVDQSHTAQALVTRDFPQITYLLGDVSFLPFKDEVFDLVIAGEIIEHMEDPKAFVKELLRVTKPEGTITLSTVDTECQNAIAHGDYPEHIWSFVEDDFQGFFGAGTTFGHVGDYQFVTHRKINY